MNQNAKQLKQEVNKLEFLGISTMPIKVTKAPLLTGWSDPTFTVSLDDWDRYIEQGYQLGIITGKKSGITVIDIDFISESVYGTDPSTFPDTYTVRTPSGSLHKYYEYCQDIHQSQNGLKNLPKVDIRNDGGQVGAPPSIMHYQKAYETGPVVIDGAYEVVSGSITELAPFPIDLFQEYITQPIQSTHTPHIFANTPGDDFELTTSWDSILQPLGWVRGHTDRRGSTHWSRPGKDAGETSATTRVCDDGRERLFVFSTNAQPFEAYDATSKNSYTKIKAYSQIHTNGDYFATVRELREQGYGEPKSEETPQEKKYKTINPADILSLDQLLSTNFPPASFAVEPFFELNAINLLSAPPNNWKSWFLFDMALKLSTGEKWLDTFATTKHKLLIVNEEDTKPRVQERMNLLSASGGNVYFYVMTGFKLTQDSVKEMVDYCVSQGITVVMLDSLRAVHNANENDSTSMQEVMDILKVFIRSGITVIATHHHKKKPKDGDRYDDAEATRGSTAINAAISGHMSLEEVRTEEDLIVIVKHLKSKATEKLKPFETKVIFDRDDKQKICNIRFEYNNFVVSELFAVQKAGDEILNYLKEFNSWVSAKELITKASYSEKMVREALRTLKDKSLIFASTRKEIGENAVGKGAGNALFYLYRDINDEEQKDLSLDNW